MMCFCRIETSSVFKKALIADNFEFNVSFYVFVTLLITEFLIVNINVFIAYVVLSVITVHFQSNQFFVYIRMCSLYLDMCDV